MSNIAIWCGRILVLIGIIGYGWGIYVGAPSFTALIPAAFGIILMVLGHIGVAREGMRKYLMHAAVIIALVGVIAALGGLFRKGMPTTLSAGVIAQLTMAVVCLVFVVLAVRSFIEARREASD